MKVLHKSTKTFKTRDNGRSADCISPNFIYGCLGGCMKSYCVEKGTLISTLNGQIPVERIQDGTFVLSYNNSLELIESKKAYCTFHHHSNSWIEIEVGQKIVVVTPEHPFYIVGKGWVEAQYLIEGDEVLCDD